MEAIFALDKLTENIASLKNSLKSSSKQSRKLAMSNNGLQLAMLILTAISTLVIVIPVTVMLIKQTLNFDNEFLLQFGATIFATLVAIFIFFVEKKVLNSLNFNESVTLNDKLDIKIIKKEDH